MPVRVPCPTGDTVCEGGEQTPETWVPAGPCDSTGKRECCAWSRRQRTRRGKPWGELRPRHISRDTPSEHRKPLHCFNFSSSESTLHTPAHGVQGENPSKRITKPRSSSASRCRQVPLAAGVRPPGCPRRLARGLAHCRSSVTKAALVCSQKLPLWLT